MLERIVIRTFVMLLSLTLTLGKMTHFMSSKSRERPVYANISASFGCPGDCEIHKSSVVMQCRTRGRAVANQYLSTEHGSLQLTSTKECKALAVAHISPVSMTLHTPKWHTLCQWATQQCQWTLASPYLPQRIWT